MHFYSAMQSYLVAVNEMLQQTVHRHCWFVNMNGIWSVKKISCQQSSKVLPMGDLEGPGLTCSGLWQIVHHHHRVACPSVSTAVPTSWRHFERSCTRIHAVMRPRLWGRRSSSIVPCPTWSTCLASPICWRTIDGCSKNARQVGSRKMSEQTKSSLCDNWGDWGFSKTKTK